MFPKALSTKPLYKKAANTFFSDFLNIKVCFFNNFHIMPNFVLISITWNLYGDLPIFWLILCTVYNYAGCMQIFYKILLQILVSFTATSRLILGIGEMILIASVRSTET